MHKHDVQTQKGEAGKKVVVGMSSFGRDYFTFLFDHIQAKKMKECVKVS